MSELKATPGPWVVTADGLNVKNAEIDAMICEDGGEVSAIESKANAHLIAAAPELYVALLIAKDIILRYANNTKRIAGYSNIEDAIAKARGEVDDD